jgi:hypothetical protein
MPSRSLHRRLDKIEHAAAAAPRPLALAILGDVVDVPPAPGATPAAPLRTFADAAALRAWADALPPGVPFAEVHLVGDPPEITVTPPHAET